MIREWSYINKVTKVLDFDANKNFKILRKNYIFKVFKYSIKFRKYTRYLTKIVRKKNWNRKKRLDLISILKISKVWVLGFLSQKQFYRFSQNLYLFNLNIQSPSKNFILKKFEKIEYKEGVLFNKLSNKFLLKFGIKKKINYNSYLMLNIVNLKNIKKVNFLPNGLTLAKYDNLYYTLNCWIFFLKNRNLDFFINFFINFFLKKLIIFRKIFLLLVIKNIFFYKIK